MVRSINIPFRFDEYDSVKPHALMQLLKGKRLGYIFKKAVSPRSLQIIRDNFWSSSKLTSRQDEVPAFYIGNYHYHKPLAQYLSDAKKSQNSLSTLFNGTENIVEAFLFTLADYIKPKDITLRVAQHQGQKASPYIMRAFCNKGEDILKPHDDEAQCLDPQQHGFEIQKVINFEIIAVNICLENDAGGNLQYWNFRPTKEIRQSLGIENTGYPYPKSVLNDYEKLELAVNPGDIYCFNGSYVHGVKKGDGNTKRSTLSFLMGFIDENTVIYWA